MNTEKPDSRTPPKTGNRLLFLLVLGLAVFLILPQITTLPNSLNVLKSMIPWLVILGFASQIASYIGSGYLMQQTLLLTVQLVSLLKTTLIVLGSTSISMIAGGTVGGSAAIYHWTRRENGSIESGTLASVLPWIFNNLMLILISIFGLVYLLFRHDLTNLQLIGFSITLGLMGLVIGLFLFGTQHQDWVAKGVNQVGSWIAARRKTNFNEAATQGQLARFFAAWTLLLEGKWYRLLIGAAINTGADILTLFFLFLAAGTHISPGVLLAGYGLPLLLGKIAFILPGGIGAVEASMAAIYTGLGIQNGTAVVVILAYRLISFWIPSLLGFPVASYLERLSQQ